MNGVSGPFPEANRVSFRGHRHRGRGRGRGRNNYQVHGGHVHKPANKSSHLKWVNPETSKGKEKCLSNKPSKHYEETCYRCGMKGHWSRVCRTPKHLEDLYQASIKEKGKGIEMNFADHNEAFDNTSLDVSDFLIDPDEKIDFVVSNGNAHTS